MQDYFDEITRCLMSFQYIEEALKQNLTRLNVLIYFRIKKYVPYDLKANLQSINNAAMGRLIDLYKSYCNDDNLISDLRKIKDHRDKIAHQGLLMTSEEIHDEKVVKLKTSEFKEIKKFAEKSMNKLLESWKDIETILNQIAAEQRAQTDSEESPASD
jgi:hypothetical protein